MIQGPPAAARVPTVLALCLAAPLARGQEPAAGAPADTPPAAAPQDPAAAPATTGTAAQDAQEPAAKQALEPQVFAGGTVVYDPEAPPATRGLELTLEAAIELALQNDLGTRIEALASDVALYDWRGSWGAFDWLVSARGGVSDREGPSQSALGGEESNTQSFSFGLDRPLTTGGLFGASFDTANTETNSTVQLVNPSTRDVFSLSYTQPLLRGAWSRYATSQQRELEQRYQGQLESQRQVRQALVRSVSDAYWDLVSAREQLEVARSSLDLAREQVNQNQRRLDAGVGTDVEVLQAEAEVATREERRLFADVRTRQASDRLKQLIFPGTDQVLWDAALVPLTPLPAEADASVAPPWTAALAVALEMRPELRQQRRQIEGAEERHLRRKNERWPALDLELVASSEGFSGDSSDAFEDAAQYEFPTYTASLIFSVPIENRTARNAAKAAWAELRAARLVYDQIETQIAGEVREAVRQVIYQALAVQAARKSLQLAERQLAAEQARYAEDLSTTFQVLEFQQELALAMSSERAARANYAKALVALEAAVGRIGEAAVPAEGVEEGVEAAASEPQAETSPPR